MKQKLFKVLKPGLHTTIQDLGRIGFQQYGIVVAGAMDQYAMQMANLLVGNDRQEAVIEVTLMGPTFEILSDCIISICGAHLSSTVDGSPIKMWKSIKVKKGQVLSFGAPIAGVRTYIAVLGGIEATSIMGSKSTYVKGKMGGFQGRELVTDDIIDGWPIINEKVVGRMLPYRHIQSYRKDIEVRVVMGPDEEAFTDEGIETFFGSIYKVTSQADRMGYRFKGPKIKHKKTADIISDAIPFGGIQVPANGEPIILMADRQTTGGYTRIGTVISVDLPLVAQALPGSSIAFRPVSVEKAQLLYRKQERLMNDIELNNKYLF